MSSISRRSPSERGLRNPSVIVLYELATVLGRDPRDLLDPSVDLG
jgi:transcriptional regulator with XRE-family HTH domain